jgi:mono/diheme cytochrome c family protein
MQLPTRSAGNAFLFVKHSNRQWLDMPKLQNPVQPNSGNLRVGMKIYRDNCVGCHGDSGKPSHWETTGFYSRVPQFALEPPLKPDWQMFWILKRGVRYTGMGAWEGEMSDDNIWTVVLQGTDARRARRKDSSALFGASRTRKSISNDADRLRKYLGRFGLEFSEIQNLTARLI